MATIRKYNSLTTFNTQTYYNIVAKMAFYSSYSNYTLMIGNTKADYNKEFNVVFQVSDINDLNIGNNNTSYPIKLPLTDLNKRLISHSYLANSKNELVDNGRLYIGDCEILRGNVKVLHVTSDYAELIIEGDNWIDGFADKTLREIDWTSSDDHTYNETNLTNSWTGNDKFIRYPMINLGALSSGEDPSSSADHYVSDFIPMHQCKDIFEKITSPYTIESVFMNTDYFKLIYMLGVLPINEDIAIEDMDLDVRVNATSDNKINGSHPGNARFSITLDKPFIDLDNEIIDEANAWSTVNDRYDIPQDGAYRFKATIEMYCTHVEPNYEDMIQTFIVYIKYFDGITTHILDSFITSEYNGDGLTLNNTYNLDTSLVQLETGESHYVYVDIYAYSDAYKTTGGSATVEIYTTIDTKLELLWGDGNRYPAAGSVLNPDTNLPDIKCIDFIKGLKHMYNLRFFVDKLNQKIHIEPYGDFIGTVIKDWTDRLDYSKSISIKNISEKYNERIIFKYRSDGSDRAYKDWVARNDEPFNKEISLASKYTKKELEYRENPIFSSTVSGTYPAIIENTVSLLRIYGDADYKSTTYYPKERPNTYEPRILKWEGLTSGMTWYLSSALKTTYPKAVGIGYETLYSDYFIKTFHHIDKGKLFIATFKIHPHEIMQFQTVMGIANEEGFRAIYKLKYNNEEFYGILQKITTNGYLAKCEFIVKN